VDSLPDVLAAHDYPGRGVLWCTTGDGTSLGAYFLTGRSPASQARTLRRTAEDSSPRTRKRWPRRLCAAPCATAPPHSPGATRSP